MAGPSQLAGAEARDLAADPGAVGGVEPGERVATVVAAGLSVLASSGPGPGRRGPRRPAPWPGRPGRHRRRSGAGPDRTPPGRRSRPRRRRAERARPAGRHGNRVRSPPRVVTRASRGAREERRPRSDGPTPAADRRSGPRTAAAWRSSRSPWPPPRRAPKLSGGAMTAVS